MEGFWFGLKVGLAVFFFIQIVRHSRYGSEK